MKLVEVCVDSISHLIYSSDEKYCFGLPSYQVLISKEKFSNVTILVAKHSLCCILSNSVDICGLKCPTLLTTLR